MVEGLLTMIVGRRWRPDEPTGVRPLRSPGRAGDRMQEAVVTGRHGTACEAMRGHERVAASLGWRGIGYAGGLTAIAGFIDGVGFIHLGGYFVSFMSGNSTRAASALAQGRIQEWMIAVGLVGSFVLGVMIGTVAGRVRQSRRRSMVLSTSSALLLFSALSTLPPGGSGFTAPLMAAAMGAMNVTYTRGGEVAVGLTYMTGTLVKMGQQLTAALSGGSRTMWIPYAVLWCMIAFGALTGVLVYGLIGLDSLWVACVALTGWTALAAWRSGPLSRAEAPG